MHCPQVLHWDAYLEGHVLLAQDYKQGRIPVTALCNARGVVKYFNARQPSCAGDLQAMAYQIRAALLDKLHLTEGALYPSPNRGGHWLMAHASTIAILNGMCLMLMLHVCLSPQNYFHSIRDEFCACILQAPRCRLPAGDPQLSWCASMPTQESTTTPLRMMP